MTRTIHAMINFTSRDAYRSVIPKMSQFEENDDNISDIDYFMESSYNQESFLGHFHEWFLKVYGYGSIVICVFGVFTNIFNITVLMAKDMRTATNHLLTFLAIADILTMLPFIPYAINFYCPVTTPMETPEKYSYGWVLYMVVIIHLLATTHTIAIWLAVTLAVFRFSQIRSPCPSGPLAKDRRINQVKIATAIIYILSIVFLIPNYVTNEIEEISFPNSSVQTYSLKDMKLGSSDMELIVFTNVLTYAILAKIIPCVLILVFSGSLLYLMGVKAARRRQRLSSTRQSLKTTRMLLVVLILFILTELPQGILLLLSATVPGFSDTVYYYLGELVDFVALLNNAINFILYCLMSQQFRNKFLSIYIKPVFHRGSHVAASTSELLMLRDQAPRTLTTTTQEEIVRV